MLVTEIDIHNETHTFGVAALSARTVNATEGWVHSTESFGTVDGPGIRYIVFMSGCPLRCQYCHNPDTHHRRDGTLTAVEDVMQEISKYRGFLKGGGVTLSGGEPLVQPRFCKSILRACKEMGLHTALDTSGHLGAQADDALLKDVDLVLLDIKAFTERSYHRLTGVDLKPTINFAKRLAELRKPVWLRYVLVPELTDKLDEIESLAQFAAKLGNIERVDVLPFHKLGEHKWRERGLKYQLTDVQPPSQGLIDQAREVFARAGLFVN